VAISDFIETINAKIRSDWTLSRVAWPNEKMDPDLETFIKPVVKTSTAQRENMGAERTALIRGILYCNVCVLQGTGQVDALALADEFLSLFSDQTLENIEFEPGTASETGVDANQYFVVTAKIPFLARV
jgi:hypothetical protein